MAKYTDREGVGGLILLWTYVNEPLFLSQRLLVYVCVWPWATAAIIGMVKNR